MGLEHAQARHRRARAGRRGTGGRASRRAGAEAGRRAAARARRQASACRAGADDVALRRRQDAAPAPAAEAPPPAAAEASGEAEGEALEAAEEEASGAAEAEADGDESESEEEFGENDAVVVRWGKKEYDAVVLEVKSRGARRVYVQFDNDNACAWVAPGAVRLMAEAEASALPGWLRVGKAVEAVDPLAAAGGAWHAATLEDARQGLDGVRLWLRYKKSGGGQWARLEHVRKPGTAAPAPARRRRRRWRRQRRPHRRTSRAVPSGRQAGDAGGRAVQLSRDAGPAGCEVWAQLRGELPAADAYVVWFGDAEATDVELLAPGVVVARVPAEAAAGPAAVRAAVRAADGALTQLAGERAFEVERAR